MKLNLEKLRKQGWTIKFDEHQPKELEFYPPPMNAGEHQKLVDMAKRYCATQMGVELVLGELYNVLGKAVLVESLEG